MIFKLILKCCFFDHSRVIVKGYSWVISFPPLLFNGYLNTEGVDLYHWPAYLSLLAIYFWNRTSEHTADFRKVCVMYIDRRRANSIWDVMPGYWMKIKSLASTHNYVPGKFQMT